MKIELYTPTIRRKEMDAVLTAMVDDKIGPVSAGTTQRGEQGERLFLLAKDVLGAEYSLALRSPAVALSLALDLLDLSDGDGVVLSTLSPCYYQRVLEEKRLVPVYCDAEAGSALLHADGIRWAMEHSPAPERVKALVMHHPLGFLADMEAIAAVGLPIIEDVSSACFSKLGEQNAGAFATVALLGMEENDMLTAGGGALLYATERRIAGVLKNRSDLPPEYKLPGMNAAMAAVQLKEAKKSLERRAEIAAVYTEAALRSRHKLLVRTNNLAYNNYAFPLVLETGFKDVAAYAKKKEIDGGLAFSETLIGKGMLDAAQYQESASLALRTVLFPLYPRLSSKEAERVAKMIQTLP
jgi:dTDP-4-amino-4,6-dideoxygalactose transaminase